tara:strand:+ start:91 stop:354 length:264 start_codon:yes stop_codon:yes gene_type:complete
MKRISLIISLSIFVFSCTTKEIIKDINTLTNEDYYLGFPGSSLFYRTTSPETQEKYHYSECKKKNLNGDQLRIESCVSSYWLKAKSL